MSGERDTERLYTAVLVPPSRERRRLRKQRRQAAAELVAEQRNKQQAEAREKKARECEEQRATRYLPAAGEPGPAMLRTPGKFRLPRHQDTSAMLSGAYPFLAEGGLGSQGVFIGQDLYSGGSFVYDPWVLYANGVITAPNVVVAGIVGSGKSSLAKSLYTRSLGFGRRVYIPGDPKGEHTAVATGVESKEFIASRFGPDAARMNIEIGTPRRLSQMESPNRKQPERTPSFEPVEQEQPEHEQPARAL